MRDNASLDIEPAASSSTSVTVPASIDHLAPSTEPNRGHGNEGMNRTAPKPKQDDVLCNECRAVNGHLPHCSHRGDKPKEQTTEAQTEQDRKTSKQTQAVTVLVESIERKTRKPKPGSKGKEQPYMLLHVIDGGNNKWPMYVWKTDLFEYLADSVNKQLTCEVSESEPDGQQRVFVSLQHISQIGQQKFVDNKPVTDEGVMPPSSEQLFGTKPSREPGEDEENF